MVFCELLFFLNVVGNIFLMDLFLGGEFSTYGLEVANFVGEVDPQNRIDPMSRVFPRMTKCTFQRFGVSGTIEVGQGHVYMQPMTYPPDPRCLMHVANQCGQ